MFDFLHTVSPKVTGSQEFQNYEFLSPILFLVKSQRFLKTENGRNLGLIKDINKEACWIVDSIFTDALH